MCNQCISFPMLKQEELVVVLADNIAAEYHLDQNFSHNDSITNRIAAGKDLTDGRKGLVSKDCPADTMSCTLATNIQIVVKVGNTGPSIETANYVTMVIYMLTIESAEAIATSKHIEIAVFDHIMIDLSGQHRSTAVMDSINLDLQAVDTVKFVIVISLEVRSERNSIGKFGQLAVVTAVTASRFVGNIEIGLGCSIVDKAVVVHSLVGLSIDCLGTVVIVVIGCHSCCLRRCHNQMNVGLK